MSFEQDRIAYSGWTFDDLLLIPGYSEVMPGEVSLKTYLTPKIPLEIPLVSAAMDTVTESGLAIAMAREGGIGILHKNMSAAVQAEMVRKVKRAESIVILDPQCIRQGSKVREAIDLMVREKIGGIPVVDGEKRLCGLLTSRDLRFVKREDMLVDEVMTPRERLVTVDRIVDLKHAAEILQWHKVEKLPIVQPGTDLLLGLMTYRDITWAHEKPLASKDEKGRLRVGAAIGNSADWEERVEALIGAGVDVLVLDSAHAHSKGILTLLGELKRRWPEMQVIAGNIATGEAAAELIRRGADALKVGVGPGSICTTRVVAGIGVPQVTAIYNVYKEAKEAGIPVIADGGLRYSGDIVKALAAGASTVMAGGIFAGVAESPGEVIIYNGRQYKSYEGMGSEEAMNRGSADRYFQDFEDKTKKFVPEGISGRVMYKGDLANVVYQMLGGLRSGMGYCGCKEIRDLHGVPFVRVSSVGVRENHPHDVQVIREAANYSHYNH